MPANDMQAVEEYTMSVITKILSVGVLGVALMAAPVLVSSPVLADGHGKKMQEMKAKNAEMKKMAEERHEKAKARNEEMKELNEEHQEAVKELNEKMVIN